MFFVLFLEGKRYPEREIKKKKKREEKTEEAEREPSFVVLVVLILFKSCVVFKKVLERAQKEISWIFVSRHD